MYIYLDIETIPTQLSAEKSRIAAEIHPPGNITKAESIESWYANKSEAAIEKKWRDTALEPTWGEIVVIGLAIDDRTVEPDMYVQGRDGCERDLLLEAFDWIRVRSAGQLPTYAGHNVQFDLRFLHHRAIILDVPGIPLLPHLDPPYRERYIDTQYLWAGAGGKIKLATICRALGIDVDDEIDGSEVWDAWRDGETEKIEKHCAADVKRVRAIYRRMRGIAD